MRYGRLAQRGYASNRRPCPVLSFESGNTLVAQQQSSPSTGTDYRALVLQSIDIVQLIGQSVALKRRGKDFVGLCPFHQEKTASFHVSPLKQFFHCYGCKTGGNAIDFVIKRDRVEFIEALKVLAERAGIELSRGGPDKQKASERQLLFEAQSA